MIVRIIDFAKTMTESFSAFWSKKAIATVCSAAFALTVILFTALKGQAIDEVQKIVVKPIVDSAAVQIKREMRLRDSLILFLMEDKTNEISGGLAATINGYAEAIDSIKAKKRRERDFKNKTQTEVSNYLNSTN